MKPSQEKKESLKKKIEKTKKKKFPSEEDREKKLNSLEQDLIEVEELIATINRFSKQN